MLNNRTIWSIAHGSMTPVADLFKIFIIDCNRTLISTNIWTIWLQELSPHLIDCSIARRLLSLALLQFHTVGESEQRLDRSLFTQCIPSKSIHFNFKTLGTSSPSYCTSASSNEGLSIVCHQIVFHWIAFHQKFPLFIYKGIVVHSGKGFGIFDVSMCIWYVDCVIMQLC